MLQRERKDFKHPASNTLPRLQKWQRYIPLDKTATDKVCFTTKNTSGVEKNIEKNISGCLKRSFDWEYKKFR